MTTRQNYTTTATTQKPGNDPDSGNSIVSMEQIREAGKRIDDVAKYTPMDESSTFAEKSGASRVAFKLENLQRTGAFKIRGAYNKISQLSREQKEKGVIAASSGNHAQGVALAAREEGVDAKIVMPQGTPESKVEAVKGYGAEVVLEGEVYNDSYSEAKKLQEEEDRVFIHPYDDPEVMAGQGTLGMEMVEQFPELDAVLVAVGGGGLISGVARAVKSYDEDVEVIGVQTEGCGTAKQTLHGDSVYHRDATDTIADGIETKHVGEKTAEAMRELVDEVVYVSDKQVEAAMSLLAERQKVVTEPAGAVAAAATLFQQELGDIDLSGKNVAVPLCGGNVDLEEFNRYCEKGVQKLEETEFGGEK